VYTDRNCNFISYRFIKTEFLELKEADPGHYPAVLTIMHIMNLFALKLPHRKVGSWALDPVANKDPPRFV
jgi:hypothetical protein